MNDDTQQPEQEELYYDPEPTQEELDYDREPPLDKATTELNRSRSKYVFTTLCFLVALILVSIHLDGMFASDVDNNWFPLVAATILAIAGLYFLLSHDNVPERKTAEPAIPARPVASANELPLSSFEELIQEALVSIPSNFHEQMDNLLVRAVFEPDEEVLKRAGVKEGYTLLGLYEGVPLTNYGRDHTSYPEIITIYQRTIEEYCKHDPERIRAQVRATVLHEIAHHFGIAHEEMPIWVK